MKNRFRVQALILRVVSDELIEGLDRLDSREDTKLSPSETGHQNPTSVSSFRTRRPGVTCEKPPYRGATSAMIALTGVLPAHRIATPCTIGLCADFW